ncbi:MAG: DUF4332 domain-containing protein [Anaerolineae bacterium]
MIVSVNVLLFVVGFMVGGLLVLIVDTRNLGRRVKAAAAGKQELRERLKQAEQKLAATTEQEQLLRNELAEIKERAESLAAENESLRQAPAPTEFAGDTLPADIPPQDDELNELRLENQQTQAQLEAAQQTIAQLQAELDSVKEQAMHLQTEKLALENHHKAAAERINRLKSRVANALTQLAQADTLRQRLSQVEEQLQAANAEVSELRKKLAAGAAGGAAVQAAADVQSINGIGPTYAKRLRDAGVRTIADLAGQTAERLAEIVLLKAWQNADPSAWIAEAQTRLEALKDG